MFADEALPPAAGGMADVSARFGVGFRPALLRFPRWAAWPEAPYVAVWPDDGALPDLTETAVETSDDLAGVVLAELVRHKCFACGVRFEVVRPETAIPVLGRNLAGHRVVSGCPACGSDFGRSRIDGLALSRLP